MRAFLLGLLALLWLALSAVFGSARAEEEAAPVSPLAAHVMAEYAPTMIDEGAPAEVEGRPLYEWVMDLGAEGERGARAEAVLEALGRPALPALVMGLAGGSFGWRAPAERLLEKILPRDEGALRSWLQDRRPHRRVAAAYALGKRADAADVPRLLEVLADARADVRREAYFALASIGGEALRPVVERLVEDLDGVDAEAAFVALAHAGEVGAAHARRVLERATTRQALDGIWRFGGHPRVASALALMLGSDAWPVRAWSANTLRLLRHLPEEAHAALYRALADESNAVAWAALWALHDTPMLRMAPPTEEARAALAALSASDDPAMAAAAAALRVQWGERVLALVPPLVRALAVTPKGESDQALVYEMLGLPPPLDEVHVPLAAAEDALAQLGEAAVPTLEAAREGPGGPAIVRVLARLGPAGRRGLQEALADERPQVREEAALALLEAGLADARAVDLTLASLADYGRIREEERIVAALAAPGAPVAPLLAAVLDRDDLGFLPTHYVIRGLIVIGPSGAKVLPDLLARDVLQRGGDLEQGSESYPPSPDTMFLAQVVDAMGPSAVPLLAQALESDNEEIRRRAYVQLHRLGGRARSALPAIQRAIDAGAIEVTSEDLEAFAD